MDISDKEKLREDIIRHYYPILINSPSSYDPGLLDEAIATIEHFYATMSENEVLHHSRQLAIPYLALLTAKDIINKE